jgi:Rhodopirellula transposase DDE domain
VHCTLDTGSYPTGVSYTDKQVAALPLQRHDFHGDWNYTCDMRSHTASELEDGRVD